ncbi:LysR family transcriptional regulator [Roseisalinus antarcticus]|uniref:HTH-type transcriptional regulator CynR n=1 Tax=Roseisalinus antarcticus TaxID=254357 RepID=A0A1Y5TBY6_9RHOB|nr:LysR family transcriptional regulator [Roseisalinus antarcticus]SLN56927.1 HTH-type transcriptional regulator CynR [Roseisalinus antarcticus]
MGAQISIRHFRCFIAVAETRSFTLAANRLFQTQSSLTATIKQLEELAGIRLFDRSTRRVELTQDAIWFKKVAEDVIRDFDNAISDLRASSEGRKGHVRIAAASSMIVHVLGPTLVAFRKRHPGISFSVFDEGADRIERHLIEGKYDFGLSSRLNNFPDLNYRPILADKFGAVFPKDHPLAAHEGKVSGRDLEPYEYIGLTTSTGIGAGISSHTELEFATGKGESNDYASSTTSLFAILKLGGKYSLLPALAASSEPVNEFEFREMYDPEIEREICLITQKKRTQSPTTQRLLEAIIDTLSNDSITARGVRRL